MAQERHSAAGRRHTSDKSHDREDLDNEEAQKVIANKISVKTGYYCCLQP